MSIINKQLVLKWEDGSGWEIPVAAIISHRANFYGVEDTIGLFKSDDYEVEDWAKNNMNWEDIKPVAKQTKQPELDMQDIWLNGEMSVI